MAIVPSATDSATFARTSLTILGGPQEARQAGVAAGREAAHTEQPTLTTLEATSLTASRSGLEPVPIPPGTVRRLQAP